MEPSSSCPTRSAIMMLPGDGWFAEYDFNGEAILLRVICFVLSDSSVPFLPPPQAFPSGSVMQIMPNVQAMVPTKQGIVPALSVPGFMGFVSPDDIVIEEEETQDAEETEDEAEGEDEDEDEDYQATDEDFDPPRED